MAVKSVDALRLGESELKEALAQGQATERELRARLSIEAARLTKVEESLERLLKKATSEPSGSEPVFE